MRALPFAVLSAALAVVAASGADAAPSPPAAVTTVASLPFVRGEAEAAVGDLATKLEENFVFPEVGKQYAAMLRASLAAGKYARFDDAQSFAKAITDDLQAVHKDGHLHLEVARPDPKTGKRQGRLMSPASGVEAAGWLADGVAYIRFSIFPGNEATLNDVRKFVADYANAKTLIIDARAHHGGGMDEMNVLFPAIYSKQTTLLSMDTRVAVAKRFGEQVDEPFVRTVAGPDTVLRQQHYVVPAKEQGGLASAKVFLLVSHDTVSAAEHMSLALKRTHRATLIGERTRGAGNYGMFMPIAGGYVAFVPFGRTFDPETGEGWEGTGVAPDIAVDPKQALILALEKGGLSRTEAVKVDAAEAQAVAPSDKALTR